MAEIVNLKLARKRKARAEQDAVAEANRAKFGRTKAERDRQAAEKKMADRHIDAHKREGD
jgi:hypothetical protein